MNKDTIKDPRIQLNARIIKVRSELQQMGLKKSGYNKHAGFEYYELSDFLPQLNIELQKNDLNDCYTIEDNSAILRIWYQDVFNEYRMPFMLFETPLSSGGKKIMQDIQYLGAINTYYKRYIYKNAYGIVDGEVIDVIVPESTTAQKKETLNREHPRWNEAVSHIKKGGSIADIETQYNIDYDSRIELKRIAKH